MKTILSTIDWYVPGYKAGGVLKAFANQVSHLEDRYRFRIVTRNTDYCETLPYPSVQPDTWTKRGNNTEVFYLSASSVKLGQFRKLFRETAFDILYIHGIYSFWFSILPVVLGRLRKKVRIVVAVHGMLGKHSVSVKPAKKKIFALVAKITGFYRGVIFHAANSAEAEDVRRMLGNKTKVLIAEELPMKMEHDLWNPRRKDPGTVRLLSVARIAPEKNTAYALEVLKECWSGLITYDIYGQVYDSGYWEECKKIIAQMPANITVNYLGSLPGDQVLDRMQEYHLMFMPTTGENFGHTILESLMSSTPVLISDRTPWLKLEEMGAGWDIPLGRKDLFAACIGKVVEMGQESYNLLSRNAWLMADRFLKNPSLVSQNINLFEDEK